MLRERAVHWLLRGGVAFAFLYPPVTAFFEPYTWLGYVPAFARLPGVDELLLLHVFGIIEIGLALWILSGVRIFFPSLAAALFLILIVVVNPQEFPILFRDLSIAAMAVALAFWDPKEEIIAKS